MLYELLGGSAPVKKQVEEKTQTLSIKYIGRVCKNTKTGQKNEFMHLMYMDHDDPKKVWNDRYIRARSVEARNIAQSYTANKEVKYHVRSVKNNKGSWKWRNIEPISAISIQS